MSKLLNPRNLAFINLFLILYFALLWVIYILKIEHPSISFLVELLTIPFLLAQLIFFLIGIQLLFKSKLPIMTQISVYLAGVCLLITIGSFF